MVGLSDHTSDIVSSLSASANNVVAIEKHFKLKKTKSVDSQFSIDPDGLRNLETIRKNIFIIKAKKKTNHNELQNKFMRRSIYTSKNIKKGEKFSSKNIKTLRPKLGICSSYYFNLIGKKAKKNIKKDTLLKKMIFDNF